VTAADRSPVALIILDGWGHRVERDGNAVLLAETPTWDALCAAHPQTLLEASGRAVGLPAGQMGNSEVGHLNLGAGRVVMQDLVRLAAAIEDGSFARNAVLTAAVDRARDTGRTLHLMGLIGDGGVHAHDDHLLALLALAHGRGARDIALHLLLDGRDTPPRSGLDFLEALLARVGDRARVATIGGRYYGMDRDHRWARTELWYRAAVEGIGPRLRDARDAVRESYAADVTDEFVLPVVVAPGAAPAPRMVDGDVVLCWNFRSDRLRQMVRALVDPGFAGFPVPVRPALDVVTLTQYDATLAVPVAFPPQSLAMGLTETLSAAGRTVFKTAETEKYPHVTFFFNGGVEAPFPGEERRLVPSPKVATYDLQPEMSAPEVTEGLCAALLSRRFDFLLCNYANGDMVGHTGSLPAAIRAVETLDACLARVLDAARVSRTRCLITADHGNCETMIDPATGGPHTAHTTNPVPFLITGEPVRGVRVGGALCDVAPTVLAMLGLPRPAAMTGEDLRR
jgi:2,3-bisphosphoglycerate-independent phosphoglycerate mutase